MINVAQTKGTLTGVKESVSYFQIMRGGSKILYNSQGM